MVKLFSNFDTKSPSKNYAEAVQEFWFDKVIFLRRHRLYLVLYTIIPAWISVLWLIFLIYSIIVSWSSVDTSTIVMHRTTQILVFLLIVYLLLIARSKYFNYKLDYSIITPTYISAYNQKWIFSREIRTIEPSKIKTIDFTSKWLINSLFNFGAIIILLEGDEMGQGEIHIDFIYNPEGIKESIQSLTTDRIIQSEIFSKKET